MSITEFRPEPSPVEWFDQVPRSIRRLTFIGLLTMIVAFGGFGAWAFMAPLAAAIITQGSFVATGNNKQVQHLEGGIINKILVAEGDTVTEGQPLIELDRTSVRARLRELFLRRARLEIVTSRLLAQFNGDDSFDVPTFLTGYSDDPEIRQMIFNQNLSFDSSKAKIAQDIGLLESNMLALKSRKEGFQAQLQALEAQIALLDEDITSQADLLTKGLTQRSQVNSLSRARADGIGQIGQLNAEILEVDALLAKHEQQIQQVMVEQRKALLDELQSAENELDTVRENYNRALEVDGRSVILSPVSGTVVQMNYNTPGGVIESGKTIAEILPSGAPLIIEAKLPRTDIDSVKVGQHATVNLVALNRRTTPVLNGRVIYLSADAVTDKSELIPREVYLTRIHLSAEEVARVKDFRPTSGMPAQVMIQTAERTFFEYITKPITDSMTRAFREQ